MANIENVTLGIYLIETIKAVALIIIAFTYLAKTIAEKNL